MLLFILFLIIQKSENSPQPQQLTRGFLSGAKSATTSLHPNPGQLSCFPQQTLIKTITTINTTCETQSRGDGKTQKNEPSRRNQNERSCTHRINHNTPELHKQSLTDHDLHPNNTPDTYLHNNIHKGGHTGEKSQTHNHKHTQTAVPTHITVVPTHTAAATHTRIQHIRT